MEDYSKPAARCTKKYKRDLPSLVGIHTIVHTSSANLMIDAFELNLLPV